MDELRTLRDLVKIRFDQANIAVDAFTAMPMPDGDRHLAIAEASRNAFRTVLTDIERLISQRPAPLNLGRMILDAAKARGAAQ